MSQTMLLRLLINIPIILLLFINSLNSQERGSRVELYTKNNEVLKGELINVDTNQIEILVKLPKTQMSSVSHKTIFIKNNLCDSLIIPGSFNGASPIIVSSLLGIGAMGITLANQDEANYYVSGTLGIIIGFFSYIFIDNTLSSPDIKFTEIDKYPWKVKPFSRNYKIN